MIQTSSLFNLFSSRGWGCVGSGASSGVVVTDVDMVQVSASDGILVAGVWYMFLSLLFRWINNWSSLGSFHSTLASKTTSFCAICFFPLLFFLRDFISYSLGRVWASFIYVYFLSCIFLGLCVQFGSCHIRKKNSLVRKTIKFKHKKLLQKDLPFHKMNCQTSLEI